MKNVVFTASVDMENAKFEVDDTWSVEDIEDEIRRIIDEHLYLKWEWEG